ncbi:MAG: hypothetical protein JRE64_02530 [Deltaproteobacteria bacterium]|nr:hypothetical protein [Deltaproteobacteria bacterium]
MEEIKILEEFLRRECESLNPGWKKTVISIFNQCKNSHNQADFSKLVHICESTGYRRFLKEGRIEIPVGKDILSGVDFNRIIVVIGPGLGLGDEISCFEVFKAMQERHPKADIEILSYTPGLWRQLTPSCKVHSLRGNPLKAYDRIIESQRLNRCDDMLVLFVNFIGLELHLTIFDQGPRVAEIAIGAHKVSVLSDDLTTIETFEHKDPISPNNYRSLRLIGEKLFGHCPAPNAMEISTKWSERMRTKSKKNTFSVFLNPFTSKPILLTTSEWAKFVETALAQLPESISLECTIFQGLSEKTLSYAKEIAEKIRTNTFSPDRLVIKMTSEKEAPLDSDRAVSDVSQAILRSDLVFGIDTYTAHLAVALERPTLALCYQPNIEFWADHPLSWWVEIRQGYSVIANLIGLIVNLVYLALSHEDKSVPFNFKANSDISAKLLSTVELVENMEGQGVEELCALGQNLWQSLPPEYTNLLKDVDQKHSWPAMMKVFQRQTQSSEVLKWLLDVFKQTHFYRMSAVMATLKTD